ncbi:MAG: spore protease YyaC [Peptococcaceae bacterium]|nr:spore protease YyaC [Peptococcaceae bacterium]
MNPLSVFSENQYLRAHYTDRKGIAEIQEQLQEYINRARERQVILLCIGTDRSTGDCLGPLTGTKLKEKCIPGLSVMGTLEDPIHAENLEDTLKKINSCYHNPFIIALDACLGRLDSIGYITLAEGPLKPGTAVKKELPEVGEIHLTGIVNINGFMQYMVLQNTRLNIIWQMSDAISNMFYKTYISNTIRL